MDPFSQAALGAVVARTVAPKDMAKGVILMGALAGAAPDIDVLFSINGDYFDRLVTHRGITHSLFFAPVVGPLLGYCIWVLKRLQHGPDPPSRRELGWWMVIVSTALLSHPLLDWLTSYGTQLLLPFSDRRFAINAMPIIDPIYTFSLAIGLVLAARYRRGGHATTIAAAALVLTTAYLGYAWLQNVSAERYAAAQLSAQGQDEVEVTAFPSIFQVHYRRIVGRSDDEIYIGYVSTWHPCEIVWRRTPRSKPVAMQVLAATREGAIFDWFSMGFAHVLIDPIEAGFRLSMVDLRYGLGLDPSVSSFTITADVNRAWEVIGKPVSGGFQPPANAFNVTSILAEAYPESCQKHG